MLSGPVLAAPVASAMSCEQALANANDWKARVDQHNANPPNASDVAAVNAYNAEAEAQNAEKATIIANLKSCQKGPPEIRPVTVRDPVTGEDLPGVPPGAPGTRAKSGKGWNYPIQGAPGLDPRVETIRVMEPVTGGPYPQPTGYASYQNISGQAVNPHTGQTVKPSDPYWHIPL